MNASELHELVAGLWMMPDRSMRRGLWARVPDTKPGGLLIESETIDGGWTISFESVDRYASADGLWADTEQGSAALIRVAIEDWLLEHGCHLEPFPGGAYAVAQNPDPGEPRYLVSGWSSPDLMRALVGGAHEVADALKIPA